MKWFKRYIIGFLIAMFVFAGMDAYSQPGKDPRVGTALALAIVWPITVAVVVGSTIGEVASDGWDAEKTATRLEKS
jgi:hypothetical protein